ncbi:Putative mono-oxygenase ydhR [Arthrobacter alpinus]|uniref:Putative mono-oxygenase ydhR n=1 Tax=Arthrobacter alpinus TaxID=656366 RepID=A0A1H5L1P7_9MICC|nr:monooxygenase [Arthrobacter alpinus]SEE70507.1 Putative mono-oxygenase ydhR [Arthrobacter alpinus]
MLNLVIFDFPFEGPFGADMATAFAPLAAEIDKQPGLVWKVWTEKPGEKSAGGVYLFADAAAADDFIELHSGRLESLGVTGVIINRHEVNEPLSAITNASLSRE